MERWVIFLESQNNLGVVLGLRSNLLSRRDDNKNLQSALWEALSTNIGTICNSSVRCTIVLMFTEGRIHGQN